MWWERKKETKTVKTILKAGRSCDMLNGGREGTTETKKSHSKGRKQEKKVEEGLSRPIPCKGHRTASRWFTPSGGGRKRKKNAD